MKGQNKNTEGKSRFSSFVQRIGRLLTRRNQCIIFLITLAAGAAAVFDAVKDLFSEPVSITLYVFAGIGFLLTCTLWVKARKEKSVLLMTLRNIGYSDSLVSLLSLQTALFAAFGQDSGDLIPIMNALTGAGVCLMVLVLGIYMVRNAKKQQSAPEYA